jgi:hypothetical protein
MKFLVEHLKEPTKYPNKSTLFTTHQKIAKDSITIFVRNNIPRYNMWLRLFMVHSSISLWLHSHKRNLWKMWVTRETKFLRNRGLVFSQETISFFSFSALATAFSFEPIYTIFAYYSSSHFHTKSSELSIQLAL